MRRGLAAAVALATGLACSGLPDLSGVPGLPGLPGTPPPAPLPPNVLIVVLDDVGVDKVASYGASEHPPPTPTLDRLAAEGLRFTTVWALPLCSPTRASVMTGRFPRRTGIGHVIDWWKDEPELAPSEITLPEMLAKGPVAWDSSAVGKWHLGSVQSGPAETHPGRQGFRWWAGTRGNLRDAPKADREPDFGYTRWEKDTNGRIADATGYATTDTANDAIARIGAMNEPWLLYLAFNAPHVPSHVPPAELRSASKLDDKSSEADRYDAALEAVDKELGRVLAALTPETRARTWVFVLGDNGTADGAVRPPLDPERAKGTVYDLGVHVPLLVTGPGVPAGATSDALVQTADLFPTVAEVAGVDWKALGVPIDGVSLLPVLKDPAAKSGHDVLYTEHFAPNGAADAKRGQYAVRDARYSLVVLDRKNLTVEELYDLQADPLEREDLLAKRGALSTEAHAAYDRLRAAADRIRAAP